jgi:hypothetical protein
MPTERPSFQVEVDIVSGETLKFEMTEEWVLKRATALRIEVAPGPDRKRVAALAHHIVMETLDRERLHRPYTLYQPDWTWIIPTRNIVAIRFRDPLDESTDSRPIGFGPPDLR